MRSSAATVLLITLSGIVLGGCADTSTQQSVEKYPRKPDVSDERKSGPAMFFYEAAEADADPGNVIVIPPADKKKKDVP